MKRGYHLAGAVMLALGYSVTSAAPINLITDGGFETGTLPNAFWNISPGYLPPGPEAIRNPPPTISTVAHTGRYSAEFVDGTASIGHPFNVSPDSPIPVANITEVSFWAKKADAGNPGLAAVMFRYTDNSDPTFIVQTTSDWQQYFFTSNLDPTKVLRGIRFFGGAQLPPPDQGPSVDFYRGYIDDIRLIATVPEPGTLALLGVGLAGLAASRRRKQ